jgi:hypothetical protein
MASTHKCAGCGYGGDNFPGGICPQCGRKIAPGLTFGPWLGALVQFALAAGFMLAFRFPRPLILFFAAFIFLGTALSVGLRRYQTSRPKPALPPASQTRAAQILGIAIAICTFALFSCLLFGSVMFLNSWSAWQRFQGQSYHATSFQVARVYYRHTPGSHGGSTYMHASGVVEGNKEWMNLFPYLNTKPRTQEELESMVPAGTVIPIYLFSDLKGTARVQLIGPLPPAEANHKQAMLVLNRALTMIAALAAAIFALVRIRRSSMERREQAFVQASAAGV